MCRRQAAPGSYFYILYRFKFHICLSIEETQLTTHELLIFDTIERTFRAALLFIIGREISPKALFDGHYKLLLLLLLQYNEVFVQKSSSIAFVNDSFALLVCHCGYRDTIFLFWNLTEANISFYELFPSIC